MRFDTNIYAILYIYVDAFGYKYASVSTKCFEFVNRVPLKSLFILYV